MANNSNSGPSLELTANMIALSVCAGYLNCIFKQGQLGRPLDAHEIAIAEEEAIKKIKNVAESLTATNNLGG
ncbi:MAG: hypothetical protein K1W05_09415 [Desulfovibrio sp.]